MIASAEEFVALRCSEDPGEYLACLSGTLSVGWLVLIVRSALMLASRSQLS